MDGEETGFLDKQGKPIHYGDILQIGLGISDRKRKRVIRSGKHARLVNADSSPNTQGGYIMTREHSTLAVILDHNHS